MDNLKLVGERIKYCREASRESQDYIGNLVGVHKSTVSRWESGDTSKVGLPTIEILAKHFGVSPDWLSGKDVPMYDKVSNIGAEIEPPLTEHEAEIIKAYRSHPNMQSAVDTLLSVQHTDQPNNVMRMPEQQPMKVTRGYAAFGGDGWQTYEDETTQDKEDNIKEIMRQLDEDQKRRIEEEKARQAESRRINEERAKEQKKARKR